MLTPAGQTRGSPPSLNGKPHRLDYLSRVASPKIITSPGRQSIRVTVSTTVLFTDSLVTAGNGHPVPTQHIRATSRPRVRWVNTTASSCATNMFSAGVPALLRAAMCGTVTGISFLPRPAGNSLACDWPSPFFDAKITGMTHAY